MNPWQTGLIPKALFPRSCCWRLTDRWSAYCHTLASPLPPLSKKYGKNYDQAAAAYPANGFDLRAACCRRRGEHRPSAIAGGCGRDPAHRSPSTELSDALATAITVMGVSAGLYLIE